MIIVLSIYQKGAIINYRVAIPVCLPVHLLAIHIVYIGFNSFKNVGPTVLANGRIMCCLRCSCCKFSKGDSLHEVSKPIFLEKNISSICHLLNKSREW